MVMVEAEKKCARPSMAVRPWYWKIMPHSAEVLAPRVVVTKSLPSPQHKWDTFTQVLNKIILLVARDK